MVTMSVCGQAGNECLSPMEFGVSEFTKEHVNRATAVKQHCNFHIPAFSANLCGFFSSKQISGVIARITNADLMSA